ncbi:PREDICTED: AP2-like ethylene-responsive transcription factor At2g41710 isoform X2 [Ipomoea nil]|uniref:AP2-like ethylene-responsive transcription factor At2g41710 isoform X2 n=1 Tax=Ipomoea nil TaxID=35883 RepID=UPI00090138DC|nr:PREDICTED: AP2-like ethylene-responsive transcription factor At2g41710 isoform X2 [Ipomoea nil]
MASSSSEPTAKPEGSSGNDVCGGETSETAGPTGSDQLSLYRVLKKAKKERVCTAKERISKMPPCTAGKRSSVYRGVTRHRWTGRYEAHLWDKSTWNQNQNKKGKQVYLGAYDDEEAAARAYDLAALKYWGPGTLINFPVTDYTRDLEEMQNLSREDYLASLRRKSSGFSRGISKYRPLSSRWDSQFGRLQGADYFSSKHHGDCGDVTADNEYVAGYCMDQKIDLSSYIKWWGASKARQADSYVKGTSEETKHGCSEDTGNEASELAVQPTEPYEMPRLGLSQKGKSHKSSTTSAMSILSQCAAYKNLQEKVAKKKEKVENDENENKNTINKIDYGKTIEKSIHDAGNERLGALFGSSVGLTINRNIHPLTPILSAPLLTNYNSIDALTDPVLWTSLVPVFPSGSSRATEVTKHESGSDYTFFQQED